MSNQTESPEKQKKTQFDKAQLIAAVKSLGKPIWDKQSEGYSNKLEVQRAWGRVLEFLGLDPNDKTSRK